MDVDKVVLMSEAFDAGYEGAVEDVAEFARGFIDDDELTVQVLLSKLESLLEWQYDDNAEEHV